MTTTTATDLIEYIREDVVCIPLPLPLADLRVINCYAILASDGLTLIDPGWLDEPSEQTIRRALSALGAAPADVTRILVTHSHWDHYTRALDWQQRYGIPIHLGAEEHHTIDEFDLADGAHPQQAILLRRAGAAALADEVDAIELADFERDQPFGPPRFWVEPDASFQVGRHRLRAHWTPGHTRGHLVFELVEEALLFTGDHLLPRITPSLGFERSPESSPLTSYLESLRGFTGDRDRRMLPAHGITTASAHRRARELLTHHRDRLQLIADLVEDGHRTADDIARQMTWTRSERRIDELGTVHGMVAVLEVRAHLEHLVHTGELIRDGDGPVDHYLPGRRN